MTDYFEIAVQKRKDREIAEAESAARQKIWLEERKAKDARNFEELSLAIKPLAGRQLAEGTISVKLHNNVYSISDSPNSTFEIQVFCQDELFHVTCGSTHYRYSKPDCYPSLEEVMDEITDELSNYI